MIYRIVCEQNPGVLADGIESLEYAMSVAHVKAEEVWDEKHVSLYCLVKDSHCNIYFAVRYTPENGGTFHVPEQYYLNVGV